MENFTIKYDAKIFGVWSFVVISPKLLKNIKKMEDINKRPLGERLAVGKRPIRDFADLYAGTEEAEERLAAVRVSLTRTKTF